MTNVDYQGGVMQLCNFMVISLWMHECFRWNRKSTLTARDRSVAYTALVMCHGTQSTSRAFAKEVGETHSH